MSPRNKKTLESIKTAVGIAIEVASAADTVAKIVLRA